MAGWPGSYFQVIYPMGASAGTGTARKLRLLRWEEHQEWQQCQPAQWGPAPVVMVSGPPVGSVPAAAAGSGDGTVPGPTVGAVPAAAVGSAVGTVPAVAMGSAGSTAPGPIVMTVPAAAAGSGGGTVPVSVPVTGQAVSAQGGRLCRRIRQLHQWLRNPRRSSLCRGQWRFRNPKRRLG